MQAALKLVSERPTDQIGYVDIAKLAGVHWTTVRRHLGNKENMRELLVERREEQGHSYADTRTRVLDAAIRVFAKHGYAGATMDQVAAEAGQTKSVVYWHFNNKSDLYLAICERNMAIQAQMLPSQVEAMIRKEDRVKALMEWMQGQVEGCLPSDTPMLFFEFYATSRDPLIREQIRKIFENFYSQVSEIFRILQQQKVIRNDIDPHSLAVYIQTVINGLLLSWSLAPKELSIERFSRDAALLLWNGLSVSDNSVIKASSNE
nr:TetR family transcriptional regulator [Paenibacillus sp. NEAU-GSW1]